MSTSEWAPSSGLRTHGPHLSNLSSPSPCISSDFHCHAISFDIQIQHGLVGGKDVPYSNSIFENFSLLSCPSCYDSECPTTFPKFVLAATLDLAKIGAAFFGLP